MTSTTTQPQPPVTRRDPARGATRALLGCSAAFTVTAVIDLAMQPPFLGNHLHTAADYAFTISGFPFLAALAWLFVALRALHSGRDGRLGRVGFVATVAGLTGLAVALVASLVTADERALSPLYPLATLATFIGYVLYAVAAVRARVTPVWAVPALAAAWIVAGPIAPGRGLFLVQTAVCVGVALAMTRSARMRG